MSVAMGESGVWLARADLLLLLADMLHSPEGWGDERRSVSSEEIEALARTSGLAAIPEGAAALIQTVAVWRTGDIEPATSEYARLFHGAMACPPDETAYIRRDKGAVLADIAGFYRAFGFELSGEFQDKHDNIVVELQFAALLCVLVGRAVEGECAEHREVALHALEAFLDDHLALWLGPFSERMQAVARSPFHAELGRLLALTGEALATGLGLRVEVRALAPVEEHGTPYECGACQVGAGEQSSRPV